MAQITRRVANKLKICLASVFSIFLLSCDQMTFDFAKVYFIPFEIKTYVPIEKSLIKKNAFEIWHIQSPKDEKRLSEILGSGIVGRTDDNFRVLVVDRNSSIYIDNNGVATSTSRTGITIDMAAFERFGESLPQGQRHVLGRRR